MWPLTFFVKSLPPNTGGCANGPVIRILEKHRNDRGIYEHELAHVMQWFYLSVLGLPIFYVLHHLNRLDLIFLAVLPMALHSALYAAVPLYRLWAEVEAYKVQAKWYVDDRRPLFAQFIADSYKLRVTAAEALVMLRSDAWLWRWATNKPLDQK